MANSTDPFLFPSANLDFIAWRSLHPHSPRQRGTFTDLYRRDSHWDREPAECLQLWCLTDSDVQAPFWKEWSSALRLAHTRPHFTDSKQLPKKVFYPHPHPSVSDNRPAEEFHACLVGCMAGDWEEHGVGRALRGRKEVNPSLCSHVYCTQRT